MLAMLLESTGTRCMLSLDADEPQEGSGAQLLLSSSGVIGSSMQLTG